MAGSSAYKGGARPRPVTPCPLSEWTPTSMVGSTVLAYQVCSDAVLLLPGPCLPKSLVRDLTVHPGCFKPPFTEASFHSGRLELLFKEIDLTAEHLALLIHGVVSVDLGHEAPIMDGEFVKFAMERGKGGAAPSQGRYKPCW